MDRIRAVSEQESLYLHCIIVTEVMTAILIDNPHGRREGLNTCNRDKKMIACYISSTCNRDTCIFINNIMSKQFNMIGSDV